MTSTLHGSAAEAESLADWRQRLVSQFSTVVSAVELPGCRLELLHPRSADDLISDEDFDRDERIPYWAEIWPSSRVLAEQISELDGRGQRLLELGCGVGLAALAALARGFDVVATDYYHEALDFTLFNAATNCLPRPVVRMVDWRRFPDDLGQFDLVVAGDVLYERQHSALVASAVSRTLSANGRAWVTHPNRPPSMDFPDECGLAGLSTSSLGYVCRKQGAAEHIVETVELRRSDRSSA